MNSRPKKIFLFSAPRSRSTWVSRRISTIYNLNLINEPLRIILSDNWTNVFHHTKSIVTKDVIDDNFWKNANFGEKERFEGLTAYLKPGEKRNCKRN